MQNVSKYCHVAFAQPSSSRCAARDSGAAPAAFGAPSAASTKGLSIHTMPAASPVGLGVRTAVSRPSALAGQSARQYAPSPSRLPARCAAVCHCRRFRCDMAMRHSAVTMAEVFKIASHGSKISRSTVCATALASPCSTSLW